ncbi:MAG TPA: hypothetical protein DCR97_11135 [Deltaproteobacteria bacterium]|nr:hypothetical protein [Deltaproteobacteria bacterium]
MTRNKKRIYLLGLFAVFIVVIPLLILYSSGYRLDSRFRLVKTGGIYIINNESGAVVRLNGKTVRKAGMFEANILIRDLIPKRYLLTVEKDGYRKWKKKIHVEEKKVQICYPLLIPLEINQQRVQKYLPEQEQKGKKKKRKVTEEYSEAMKLFDTYKKSAKKANQGREDSEDTESWVGSEKRLKNKVLLFREGNKIHVRWTGMDKRRPFFIDASGKQPVFFPRRRILSFEFFPERHDSVLVLLDNLNLYVLEIDRRFGIHNIHRIASKCSRFLVKDEFVYYLSGSEMYRIDFEPNSDAAGAGYPPEDPPKRGTAASNRVPQSDA